MTINPQSLNSSISAGHDAPIKTRGEDFLGAAFVARAIHRTIKSAPKNWSTRVGLYGTWGSGKTSVLNLLEQLEKIDNSIIIRISAWSAIGESGVLDLFHRALIAQFELENITPPTFGRAKRVFAKGRGLLGIFKNIGNGAEATGQIPPGVSSAIAGIAESAFAWLAIDRKDVDALVNQLGGRRVVVFIDDLDRADPRLIPKTLLAFRELLDWPSFSFVLAFDKRVVARALFEYSAAYGENAQTFLEKVVDVPFEVPTPSDSQRSALASHAFEVCCPFVPADAISASKSFWPKEPRRIKLIARKIGVLAEVGSRHSPEDLDWSALILYHVVHEASAGAAKRVVEIATTSEQNWLLWAGEDAEKKAKELEVSSSLKKLVVGTTAIDADRVVAAAMALIRLWTHVEKTQIEYLLKLAFEEPSFTRQEFSKLSHLWLACKSDALLASEIERGARVASVTQEKAAHEFLMLAIAGYGEVLVNAADSEIEAVRENCIVQAEGLLCFLEYLWSECTLIDFQSAAKAELTTQTLVSTISRWVGWVRNPGEESLRQREQLLALVAARGSTDQEGIYDATDPYWESHHDGGEDAPAKWRALLRSTLIESICQRLFEKFSVPDGIAKAARGEDSLATWILESNKSPLYLNANLANRFANQLKPIGDGRDARGEALRSNAKLYLHMLLTQTRNASWGTSDKISEIHNRFPQIIPAAWTVVASIRVPFRMASSILNLRRDLVASGIPDEVLNLPQWLRLMAAELEALEAIRKSKSTASV